MLKFVFLPLLKSSIVNQYSLIKVSGCCNTSGDPSVVQPSQARVSLLRDDTFFGDNGGEEAASRIVISIYWQQMGRLAASSPLT
jgi:hypothetical protein